MGFWILKWILSIFYRRNSFLTIGASRSGKTTLFRAAKALHEGATSYDCRKEKDSTATGIDTQAQKGMIYLPGIELSFYFHGDYGGAYELQKQHLKKDLPKVENIVYCFDASLLAENKCIPLKKGDEEKGDELSLREYTKAVILLCIHEMKELKDDVNIKNFIFLGTHYDLVKNKEANTEPVLMDKIGYTDLCKEIEKYSKKIRVAFVYGSFDSFDEAKSVWIKISEKLNGD